MPTIILIALLQQVYPQIAREFVAIGRIRVAAQAEAIVLMQVLILKLIEAIVLEVDRNREEAPDQVIQQDVQHRVDLLRSDVRLLIVHFIVRVPNLHFIDLRAQVIGHLVKDLDSIVRDMTDVLLVSKDTLDLMIVVGIIPVTDEIIREVITGRTVRTSLGLKRDQLLAAQAQQQLIEPARRKAHAQRQRTMANNLDRVALMMVP